MKSMRCKAGHTLFSKGDPADHFYFLAQGRIEFPEIGATMDPGRVFGEVAFFVPNGRRTLSARCREDSEVLYIDQATVRELYYQNPAFGFELIGLVAARLSADVARLESQLARQAATS
jgi:CRP-like cAMP-binding protein